MEDCNQVVTTYKEVKIGRTLYCITNVFSGEKDLAKTLETLAVDKVLNEMKKEIQEVLLT